MINIVNMTVLLTYEVEVTERRVSSFVLRQTFVYYTNLITVYF
jgi:hypothetical protein